MKSIKTKLVVSFTAIVLALSLGLGLISTNVLTKHLTQDAFGDLQKIAELEAKFIRADQDKEIKYIEALAQNGVILNEGLTWEEKVAYFENEAQKSGYVEFCFTEKDGESTTYNLEMEKCNIKDREYFKKALSGKGAMSDLIIGRNTGKPEFFYAAPVIKDGEIKGVFYGKKSGTALSEVAGNVIHGKTG